MTISIVIIGILFAVFGVVLPGWGLKQILSTRGMHFRSDTLSTILSSFALGVHINAILFLAAWTFAPLDHPISVAAALITLNLAVTIAGWFSAKDVHLSRDPAAVVMLAMGCVIGVFAAYRFPSTLDSIQVLQVQNLILGRAGGQLVADGSTVTKLWHFFFGGIDVPGQSGFAGLLFVPSLLRVDMPVVTVAAANKVLLFVLAAFVSLYAVRQFRIKPVLLGATLVFANMALSKFGLYGLFETGKDSIFALLMALASMAASLNAADEQNEPGLYMSSAILLGAISVPYLMMFWALYFLFSGGAILKRSYRLAAWAIGALMISVVGMQASFARHGLVPALALGVFILWGMKIFERWTRGRSFKINTQTGIVLGFIPLLCFFGIWLVMPIVGRIVIGFENGIPITESYAPLDGKMSAAYFLLGMYPMNNRWLAVAIVLLSSISPILSPRLRTPFLLAFFSFLPVTTLFALLNVKFNISLLSHFNLWDITRDAVQWCLGVFGVLLTILGLQARSDRFRSIPALPVLVATVIFVIGTSLNYQEHLQLLRGKPMVTRSGGFDNPVSAAAMDFTWREARNSAVYVSKESPFARDFYSYQMFGARKFDYFDALVVSTESEQVFLANNRDLALVLRVTETKRSSGFVQAVADDAYMIKAVNDGKGELDLGGVPPTIVSIAGAYDIEAGTQGSFRWVSPQSALTITRLRNPGQVFCTKLRFINAWSSVDLRVRIEGGTANVEVPIARGADFATPAEVSICAATDSLGLANLRLVSDQPHQHFPNDSRNIAYGLIWPVQ